MPRLRDPERFGAWLRRLVVNAARDEGRRIQRRRREIGLEPFHEPGTGGGIAAVADRDELVRAFRRLREEDRTVVALRYYLDLSTAEAAATLGLREVTYRSRLHRALRALHAALAAEARRVTRTEEQPS
jgi:RNA polymerase sigma factor (sigma-70 family)